jgi:hypothetical protein
MASSKGRRRPKSSGDAPLQTKWEHLDTATCGEIGRRSAGLRPGVYDSSPCKGAVPEAGAPVAASRCAQAKSCLSCLNSASPGLPNLPRRGYVANVSPTLNTNGSFSYVLIIL